MFKCTKNIIISIFIIIFLVIISSCRSSNLIEEKPITSQIEKEKLLKFNDQDIKLKEFLNKHNLSIPKYGEPWNEELLIMVGLYGNKDLQVLRSEYGMKAAEIQVISAGSEKIINPLIEYHTLGKPFTFGLSIEIPNQKLTIKDLKLDIAKINSTNVALDLIHPAWQTRCKVLLGLIDVLRNEVDLMNYEIINKKLKENIVLAENNYRNGIIPYTELSKHKILLEKNNNEILLVNNNIKAAKIKLASTLSVPAKVMLSKKFVFNYDKLVNYKINDESYDKNINHALLNRADIIKSLSEYAKVEAELRLIVIESNRTVFFKPALLWDQTDLIFSLAGAFIPNNEMLKSANIKKYVAKRDLYKAIFIANQSLALNQIQTNYANLIISEAEYLAAISKYKFNKLQYEIMKKRQVNGDASVLDVQEEELNVLYAHRIMETAKFSKIKSIINLESVLGHDLIQREKLPYTSYMPINYILNDIEVND